MGRSLTGVKTEEGVQDTAPGGVDRLALIGRGFVGRIAQELGYAVVGAPRACGLADGALQLVIALVERSAAIRRLALRQAVRVGRAQDEDGRRRAVDGERAGGAVDPADNVAETARGSCRHTTLLLAANRLPGAGFGRGSAFGLGPDVGLRIEARIRDPRTVWDRRGFGGSGGITGRVGHGLVAGRERPCIVGGDVEEVMVLVVEKAAAERGPQRGSKRRDAYHPRPRVA